MFNFNILSATQWLKTANNMRCWYKNCPVVTLMREIEKKRIISKVLKENCGSTQVIWSTYQLGTEYSDRHKRDIMWPRTLEQVIWGKFSSFFWDYLWHLKNAPMFGIGGFCQWWNSKQKSRQNTFNLSIGFVPQKKKKSQPFTKAPWSHELKRSAFSVAIR